MRDLTIYVGTDRVMRLLDLMVFLEVVKNVSTLSFNLTGLCEKIRRLGEGVDFK